MADPLRPVPGGESPSLAGIEKDVSAVRLYCHLETRLFEVLGSWVQGVEDPQAKVCFSTHSRQHGWHAQLWAEHLSDLGADDPRREPGAAGPEALAGFFEALAGSGGADPTAARVVGAYRVALPRLVGAYTRHAERASAVSDAPTLRWLRLVLADELEEWRQGELLAQSLLREPGVIGRAAQHQGALESLLAASGVLAG